MMMNGLLWNVQVRLVKSRQDLARMLVWVWDEGNVLLRVRLRCMLRLRLALNLFTDLLLCLKVRMLGKVISVSRVVRRRVLF